MGKERQYDPQLVSLRELFEEHENGTIFLCSVCGAALTLITSHVEVREKGQHPGLYCPVDHHHVFRMFNLRR